MKTHYTYNITNIINGKSYIGARTCDTNPSEDIGIKYFSSSTDEDFMKEQKLFLNRFTYEVLNEYDTRKDAINNEILLHNLNDVGKNNMYYNKAKQTSSYFDFDNTIPIDLEYVKKSLETKSTKEVAEDLGIHWQTLSNRMKEYEIFNPNINREKVDIDIEWLTRELKTKTINDISKESGYGIKAIRNKIQKYNLENPQNYKWEGIDVGWLKNELRYKTLSGISKSNCGWRDDELTKCVQHNNLQEPHKSLKIKVDVKKLERDLEDRSVNEVSKMYGVRWETINRWIKRFNIKRKNNADSK